MKRSRFFRILFIFPINWALSRVLNRCARASVLFHIASSSAFFAVKVDNIPCVSLSLTLIVFCYSIFASHLKEEKKKKRYFITYSLLLFPTKMLPYQFILSELKPNRWEVSTVRRAPADISADFIRTNIWNDQKYRANKFLLILFIVARVRYSADES